MIYSVYMWTTGIATMIYSVYMWTSGIAEFSNDRPGARVAILYQGAVIDCNAPDFNPGACDVIKMTLSLTYT